jgi:hypothetical protein
MFATNKSPPWPWGKKRTTYYNLRLIGLHGGGPDNHPWEGDQEEKKAIEAAMPQIREIVENHKAEERKSSRTCT